MKRTLQGYRVLGADYLGFGGLKGMKLHEEEERKARNGQYRGYQLLASRLK